MATFGLILVILSTLRFGADFIAVAVGLGMTAAYGFIASTWCCQSNGNSSPNWRSKGRGGLALTHDGAPLSQGG